MKMVIDVKAKGEMREAAFFYEYHEVDPYVKTKKSRV